jgi:hypothetical protein
MAAAGVGFIVSLGVFIYAACRVVELSGMDTYYNERHPEVRATRGARESSAVGPLIFAAVCIGFVVIGLAIL